MQRATSTVFAQEILHFVQDDRRCGGVMHGVVLKWEREKVKPRIKHR
jgi:hypothetical protein